MLMLNAIIPKACKKRPTSLKTLLLVFDNFEFLNFVDINIEKFAGTNFTIAVTETLYF